MTQIGLIGAGHVGRALATQLVKLGHIVQVANSRGQQSLHEFVKTTGARAVDIADVSAGANILIIAIPFGRVPDLPKSLFSSLPEKAIVVDTGNYYPLRDGAIPAVDRGLLESEWVSQQLGIPVVKAFNNIIASRLADRGKPEGDPHRIALPVAGDDPTVRAIIMTLVEDLGLSAFNAGPIVESWRQQPGQPAYCTDPTLSELPSLLARADRERAARNRDKAAKILAKLPSDYPADELVRASRFSAGLDRMKLSSWLTMLRLALTIARSQK